MCWCVCRRMLADEAIWGAGGKLYATYDAFVFDFDTSTVEAISVAPKLYTIDPTTGLATVIGVTDLGIGAATEVNGITYAFNDLTTQIATLDLLTGGTTGVGNFDPAAEVLQGAARLLRYFSPSGQNCRTPPQRSLHPQHAPSFLYHPPLQDVPPSP
jgi:hypothetical protein